MIGRLREKQYQLTAERRNNAIIKFDHNRQTARYFERECNIAKQFNAWNAVKSTNESKHLAISRKTDSLRSRRIRLKDLLEKEEEAYRGECERVKSSNVPEKVNYSATSVLEKRAEDSLYRPRNCRRIQSYFCETYRPSEAQNQRRILKDFNERKTSRNLSRMNMDRTFHKHVDGVNDERTIHVDVLHEQSGYNERMDEYKENSRSAKASQLYATETDSKETRKAIHSALCESRPAAGLDSCEHRPRVRRLHDSHFLLGNQTFLNEEGGAHMPPNQKFQDRYANKSLEMTNVSETGAHEIEENPPAYESEAAGGIDDVVAFVAVDPLTTEQDQTDRAWEKEQEEIEQREDDEKVEGRPSHSSSMSDNASRGSQQEDELQQQQLQQLETIERNEQRDIDREVSGKASAGRSDHRHFETERSLPWMRMIPGDKNLSEQMFLYLAHNELKGQIQDLEKRENQAASKHQWDEALRLRDMRNRLVLARERNLYRRDDLMLDPKIKALGMAAIEARQKLLKEREELCTNSSMYSEEAKVMWDQWVIEDKGSVLEDARLQREDLMEQLEANWRSLAIEDKQKITDSFKNKEYVNVALQNDHDNACAFRPASR